MFRPLFALCYCGDIISAELPAEPVRQRLPSATSSRIIITAYSPESAWRRPPIDTLPAAAEREQRAQGEGGGRGGVG